MPKAPRTDPYERISRIRLLSWMCGVKSCLTHACQTLGHPFPVLCRTGVGRAGVLLDPRSSLLALRLGLRLVVRATLRYFTSVRLLRRVHAGCTAFRLFPPVCRRFRRRHPGGLPVPVHRVSKRARALRLRGAVRRLAFYRRRPCGLRCLLSVGRSGVILSQLNHPAHLCPCLRFDGCLAAGHARLGVRMGRYSFPVRLSHSLLHAGFDRRTAKPNSHLSV